MSRLTILSVAYPFAPVSEDAVGGAEQVLSYLDRSIAAERHGSIVLAAAGSRVRGALVTHPAPAIVDEEARRSAHVRYAASIAHILESVRVDVVHMHGLDFMEYLPASGPAVVATLHLPIGLYPRDIFSLERRRVELVCVSTAQRATCPITRDVRVVPNGVRLDAFAPAQEKAREKEGYVLVLGRICAEKGIHLALEAARAIGRDLVLAGRVFPYEEHERYFAEEVEPLLDARRRFVGPVGIAAKAHLLAHASCVLVPSLAPETSSLVAMEAAASGTPVVALRVGALPEIVEHERTGLVVNDPSELPAAIARAADISPDLCRRTAEERFDARAMSTRYLGLYRELRG